VPVQGCTLAFFMASFEPQRHKKTFKRYECTLSKIKLDMG